MWSNTRFIPVLISSYYYKFSFQLAYIDLKNFYEFPVMTSMIDFLTLIFFDKSNKSWDITVIKSQLYLLSDVLISLNKTKNNKFLPILDRFACINSRNVETWLVKIVFKFDLHLLKYSQNFFLNVVSRRILHLYFKFLFCVFSLLVWMNGDRVWRSTSCLIFYFFYNLMSDVSFEIIVQDQTKIKELFMN